MDPAVISVEITISQGSIIGLKRDRKHISLRTKCDLWHLKIQNAWSQRGWCHRNNLNRDVIQFVTLKNFQLEVTPPIFERSLFSLPNNALLFGCECEGVGKDCFQQCWMIQGVNLHEREGLRWRVKNIFQPLWRTMSQKWKTSPNILYSYMGLYGWKMMKTNSLCNHQVQMTLLSCSITMLWNTLNAKQLSRENSSPPWLWFSNHQHVLPKK